MIHVAGNRIVIDGDVDMTNGEVLAAAVHTVHDAGHTAVVFDLTRCTFIGSTGLAALSAARARGMDVIVTGASTHIKRLLTITGLNGFLEG